MPISKKVIVVLIEGITDKVSLAEVIKSLNENKKVYYQIIGCDITSDDTSTTYNILTKVNTQVNYCIAKYHFKKSDIIRIVHLVDTDGAFIPDKNVVLNENVEIEYRADTIETNRVKAIRERNHQKALILNKLSATNFISKTPYEVYYFSTNIEHVLHNIQNADDNQKMELAEKFQDKYYHKPQAFLKFINGDFAVKDSYAKTWQFIKKGTNSLKRYTNFNLFFEKRLNLEDKTSNISTKE